MEAHRKNPVCANCHKLMDPIGLAMENFDAVGRLRERDGGSLGVAIDTSGELVDGTKVDGVVSLRRALLRQPELFVGTVVEKLHDLRARPGPDGRRHAGRAGHRPRRGQPRYRLSADRPRHRQEHAVYHAHQGDSRGKSGH